MPAGGPGGGVETMMRQSAENVRLVNRTGYVASWANVGLNDVPEPVAGVPPNGDHHEYVPSPPEADKDAACPTVTVWVAGEQTGGNTATVQYASKPAFLTVTM
jgi:hypothetical protein